MSNGGRRYILPIIVYVFFYSFACCSFVLLGCWCHTWLNSWPNYPWVQINQKMMLIWVKKIQVCLVFPLIHHTNNFMSDYFKLIAALLATVEVHSVKCQRKQIHATVKALLTPVLLKCNTFFAVQCNQQSALNGNELAPPAARVHTLTCI